MERKQCRPHTWIMPETGDTGITCEECGRYLDFRKDMNANIAASITGAIRKHYPPEIAGDYAARFIKAFRAAWNAACPPRPVDPPPPAPRLPKRERRQIEARAAFATPPPAPRLPKRERRQNAP